MKCKCAHTHTHSSPSPNPTAMAIFVTRKWLFWAFLLSQLCPHALASNVLFSNQPILQPSLVDKVNSHPTAKWKAHLNARFTNTSVGDFKRLLGSFLGSEQEDIQIRTHARDLKLPQSFDAREAWPQCFSLQNIQDQGHCGSCWAFGAVEALSDRFCIHFNESVSLSENDLLSCCGFECGFGCDGGFPLSAWQYFVRSGVVSSECDPYFDSKGCQHPGCEPTYDTPDCVQECKDNTNWQSGKHYASNAYRVNADPYDIMAEVYTNGPVEVAFEVYEESHDFSLFCFGHTHACCIHYGILHACTVRRYLHGYILQSCILRHLETLQDFAHYESGVYQYISGDYLGGHAVKLIGWGTTDEGVDYWLLANSWNRQWGQDGYCLMQRGVNECGIEGNVVAGMPASQTQSLFATQ